MKRSIECCDVFKELVPSFGWFHFTNEEGKEVSTMPFLQNSGTGDVKYRVNNCPSCGADVRAIELTEE